MGKKSKDKRSKKERKRSERLAFESAPTTVASDLPARRAAASGRSAAPGGPGVGRTRAAGADAAELAARLAGLSTVLQRHLARADAGEGLTRARLSALALLVLGGPRTLGELAAAEGVRPPTMTRLVQAMEADGLVVRQRNPADGRSVVIAATPVGVEQLELGHRRQLAPLAASLGALDPAQRAQLEEAAELLGRVLRASAWGPPPARE